MTGQKWKYPKPAATPDRICKDCMAEFGPGIADHPTRRRTAPNPGPRCHSHHVAEKRRRRLAAKGRHVEKTYGLTPEQYDALYEFQGGRCALCGVATGASKRLAVDHDHYQALLDGHDPDKGCVNCVRGLVCATDNDILAHARSQTSFFLRGAAYLQKWPTRRLADGESWPPR